MPKKSLGQNFLKSAKALAQIISAGNISKNDTVLEIGPGRGALTEKLLETGAKILCVEKDRELIPLLEERFIDSIKSKQLKIIQGDILEFNPKEIFKNKSYKIIANIPYYITGAILRKFLSEKNPPELMVLLVQKEVAERIVARDSKESILSMSVKVFGEPKYIAKVPSRYFTPEPKVDSAIILISGISKRRLGKVKEEDFFQIVKLAFGQKRKTLIKNLSQTFKNKDSLVEIFKEIAISEKSRAEDLDFETILHLTALLFPQKHSKK
jgi:16S rRNA (adenine1518-N6/adenine1519-N6)-dimethyltransferase